MATNTQSAQQAQRNREHEHQEEQLPITTVPILQQVENFGDDVVLR